MSENRLGRETSPYLLQHKDNPVHWWAWGPEALAEAKTTGKPILLSIGYAACHWCHVMAHESFEDGETADVMNDLFVNIKVDREERPDIDAIYMAALHRLGEQGGWPLTMFLTSEAEPFWGGTYFPKQSVYGRPAFKTVLNEISRIHKEEPDKVRTNADAITASLKSASAPRDAAQIDEPILFDLVQRLTKLIDPEDGGTRGAPKFPQVKFFELIWRGGLRFGLDDSLAAIRNTLIHICQGGIYDHLGGGFARYSVDDRWLVPHFEKMLYDNAQLVDLLTEAWREFRDPLFAIRIEETIDWLFREMIGEGGAFASSLDADSEGVEGKFYVWTKAEIVAALGEEDASFFAGVYDVHRIGNWEGKTILNRLESLELLSDEDETRLKALREKLLEVRAGRIRPGWDDKILADWNGLMITALAKAGHTFARADWIGAAEKAYAFIKDTLISDGRLFHSYRAGKLRGAAIANDYANMISAALALYQVMNEQGYLQDAQDWAKTLDRHYWDETNGGYYFTADDTDDLILRTKSAHDDSTPNANGNMISNLMSLYLLTGIEEYRSRAEEIPRAFSADLAQSFVSHTGLLACMFDLLNPVHIVIASNSPNGTKPLTDQLSNLSLPGAVVQTVTELESIAATSPAYGKTAMDGKPTAYICFGPQCSAPITDPTEIAKTAKTLRTAQVA